MEYTDVNKEEKEYLYNCYSNKQKKNITMRELIIKYIREYLAKLFAK